MPVLVTRSIAADPTGVALLVAGPAGIELWPTARTARQPGTSAAPVVATLPRRGEVSVEVVVRPPRRTPTGHLVAFSLAGEDVRRTIGCLCLEYRPAPSGSATTHAVLELSCPGTPDAELRTLAAGFLANLAAAAEARARAA